jgi:nucleotide-binding universal stress UspA family protein
LTHGDSGLGQRSQAAVLVLGSRGRSAVREMVLGSVAMSTLHRAHRLVMIVPHAEHTAPRAETQT